MGFELQARLSAQGFLNKDNIFERGEVIGQAVIETKDSLILQLGILDPFYELPEPVYPLVLHGHLMDGGVTTGRDFFPAYEEASGCASKSLQAYLTFGEPWFARFGSLEMLSRVHDEMLEKRQKWANNICRGSFIDKVLGLFVQVAKPSTEIPPVYHIIKSLLCYHTGDFDRALLHARKTLESETDDSRSKERTLRMVQFLEEKAARP